MVHCKWIFVTGDRHMNKHFLPLIWLSSTETFHWWWKSDMKRCTTFCFPMWKTFLCRPHFSLEATALKCWYQQCLCLQIHCQNACVVFWDREVTTRKCIWQVYILAWKIQNNQLRWQTLLVNTCFHLVWHWRKYGTFGKCASLCYGMAMADSKSTVYCGCSVYPTGVTNRSSKVRLLKAPKMLQNNWNW